MQHFNAIGVKKMLSKALKKQISSLGLKKFRKESGLFVAEGGKTVMDLVAAGFIPEKIIATTQWLGENRLAPGTAVVEIESEEMKQISFQQAPQGVMGIFRQPKHTTDTTAPQRELCLALDNVQDPGNLGTIIRIADWFGIENIFCSIGTADAFNPKTIQATMGAIARVKIHYVNLPALLASLKGKAPVYGTFLNGDNIYEKSVENRGIVVMGNEGNGIGEECATHITERLLIPSYPSGRTTSESLNVSVATAIICSEFRRRN